METDAGTGRFPTSWSDDDDLHELDTIHVYIRNYN
jgi:hypothetical protein